MALPTILPVIITDRTDTLIMLDRTGGTGTGPMAIGATVDFRANTLSKVRRRQRNSPAAPVNSAALGSSWFEKEIGQPFDRQGRTN